MIHPLATYLCAPSDLPPTGCTDDQPCICLAIQASIALDTAARALIQARRDWDAGCPDPVRPRYAALEMAVDGVDRVSVLREMTV